MVGSSLFSAGLSWQILFHRSFAMGTHLLIPPLVYEEAKWGRTRMPRILTGQEKDLHRKRHPRSQMASVELKSGQGLAGSD